MSQLQYHIAAFARDGSCVGRGIWRVEDLSKRWMSVCSDMLRDGVPSAAVRVPVEGLSHLEVRYTRSGRTGLATFYAKQVIATSSLLMAGVTPEADAEVQAMFLESLRRSVPTADAFGELTEISDRPLHAVVSWANPELSDEDEELVQELSTHFAAAFLLGPHGA